MIGDNEVKDSRGVRLLSEITLYVVYRVDTRTTLELAMFEEFTCFNCGDPDHGVPKCPKPIDQNRINKAKADFSKNGGGRGCRSGRGGGGGRFANRGRGDGGNQTNTRGKWKGNDAKVSAALTTPLMVA